MQHYHSLLHWQQHAMNESHFISRLQTEKNTIVTGTHICKQIRLKLCR
jgi:hypothetical protein